MKNTQHKNYNRTDKQLLAEQAAASYIYGLISETPSRTVTEARELHSKNIAALEQTLLIFNAHSNSHAMVCSLNERLNQERMWLKHYNQCVLEHQRARNDLDAALKKAKPDKKKKSSFFGLFSESDDLFGDVKSKLDEKTREKERTKLAEKRMAEVVIEIETLNEVEAVADTAAKIVAKDKDKNKQNENNKDKQNENKNDDSKRLRQDEQDPRARARRRFLMEQRDGDNKNENRHVKKEEA